MWPQQEVFSPGKTAITMAALSEPKQNSWMERADFLLELILKSF